MASSNERKTDVTKLREELGLTQMEMAVKLGVSISTVWRWEQKVRRPEFLSLTKRLMEVTGKSLDELIEIFEADGGEAGAEN